MDECRGKGRKFSSSFPSFYITEGKLLCNPRLDFFRFSVRFSTFQRFSTTFRHQRNVRTRSEREFSWKCAKLTIFGAALFLRIGFFCNCPANFASGKKKFLKFSFQCVCRFMNYELIFTLTLGIKLFATFSLRARCSTDSREAFSTRV